MNPSVGNLSFLLLPKTLFLSEFATLELDVIYFSSDFKANSSQPGHTRSDGSGSVTF